METSKRFLYLDYMIFLVLAALTVLAVFCGKEADTLRDIAIGCAGNCAVYSGFYIWKSKNENRSKYAIRYVKELPEDYTAEEKARFLEIVLKD